MSLKPEPTPGDTSWFVHDRFGLFIHWGLYALPARHEWVKSREHMSTEQYEKHFKRFDADLYDPDIWAEAASNAGMKYVVVTTKHHEGFCLWDTKLTDYKAPNTPAGLDLLRPMVEAFRARGMRIGFYYSLIDWHHQDYTVDASHPMRENKKYIAGDKNRNLNKYAEYVREQVRELLTQFGKIDILFFDFCVKPREGFPGKGKEAWQSEKIIKMVRQLQPQIIINDRLGIPQDNFTPEQVVPTGWLHVEGKPVVWEANHTFSGSWGYHRDEETWKSVDQLIKILIDTVSKGGNLLLNVGPTGRGEFDERTMNRLSGIAEWMKRHNRSIYGCTQAPGKFKVPQESRYTYNPQTNRLYLHVFSWPFKYLVLPDMADKVEYVQLLNDASEIKLQPDLSTAPMGGLGIEQKANQLILELPVKKPNVTVPVIELFLKD